MYVVRSGFGDGVHGSSGGLAVFRAVCVGIDIELFYGIQAVGVADDCPSAIFREKGLLIAHSVDLAVVIKAGNSMKGDQPVSAVGGNSRSKENKRLPAAAIEREASSEGLANCLGHFSAIWLDDGSFAGDCNLGHR